jgi:hypothetical protein
MKFKVIDTEPPEQELRCPRCNNRFRTDPSIQMNLVLINNVLLPQCPICKTIEDEPEFKKEAKINIKDCTQTKDGTPVRIYATDGGGKFPVHGAVFNKDDCRWTILTWTITGSLYLTGDEHGLDLDLSDWKEKIPWDCLRPEIKVVARDDDGRWFGYLEEPELKMDGQYKIWRSEIMNCPLKAITMPQGPSDWKEAIARRPE